MVTGSIAHAKSLGDVWIDSMVNVGAYWRGEKVLSTVTPAMSDQQVLALYEEGSYELIPHDSMRRTIAQRLTAAAPSAA